MTQAQASIAHLLSDELKELLNDDDKLEERVNEALVSLESEKDEILNENRNFAEENLSKEPQLIELRGRINDLSTEGKTLCEIVQQKLVEVKSKSGDMNQETALALLQTAAAESEEESEKLVRDFMDKEIDLESFLEQFLKSRKTMHLRKIKSEKMSELIRMSTTQTNRNSSFIPSSGFYPMSGGSVPYPTSTSVPYPLGPMPMPMPGMPRPY